MIHTQGLAYQFAGATAALRFPDVDLPQGGTLLLRGPSGCGKSTWLGLVSGLLSPTAGRVSVAGTVLNGLSGSERDAWRARQVGVLPQRLHLSESLSVHDNLALVYFAAGLPVDHRAMAERRGGFGPAPTGPALGWAGAAGGAGARAVVVPAAVARR